jgi:crotonobetainyl-CoA:carnitine CoA-transferase CaiB-like acyl-CoA transferase
MNTEKAVGALHGLKVIDLTQILAGPLATQLLADQGAEVIKIEPLQGEFYRHGMPCRDDYVEKKFPGYFVSMNRNKKSVSVDLSTEPGREIVRTLVGTADVFVENFRAGVSTRLGLSYEKLRAINQRLVYASIRGFGATPDAGNSMQDWPAFDITAQAIGGVMSCTGPDSHTPLKVGPSIGDHVSGILCAFGIMAAVYHAKKTGQGQHVEVALADSMLLIAERIIHQYSVEGAVALPQGNHHPVMCPYGAFPANDGWVTIACPSDAFWSFVCRALDAPQLLHDPRYQDTQLRSKNRIDLQAELAKITMRFSKAQLSEKLGGHVPFAPVLDAAEIMENPYFRARNMLVPMDYGLAAPIVTVGVPVRLSETPGGIGRRAPLLGEHSNEVLCEHGYSLDRINELRDAAVLR